MTKVFKYDVAISFAEEDRNAALAMSLALELSGFSKVYYYPDHRASGIGLKIEQKLIETYMKDSHFVVLFLSRNFFNENKVYTKIELEAIKQRILYEPDIQYVIPILLDDSVDVNNDDVLAGREYIKWEYNPKEIASFLEKNFGQHYPEKRRINQNGSINLEQINVNSNGGDQTNTMNFTQK